MLGRSTDTGKEKISLGGRAAVFATLAKDFARAGTEFEDEPVCAGAVGPEEVSEGVETTEVETEEEEESVLLSVQRAGADEPTPEKTGAKTEADDVTATSDTETAEEGGTPAMA